MRVAFWKPDDDAVRGLQRSTMLPPAIVWRQRGIFDHGKRIQMFSLIGITV
ncbi:MAG: hypothetical protein HRT36_07920 [Alphaproteobacteria bacterium]|nr:hypothetical protein [Alphaproteobacteria bacterium]